MTSPSDKHMERAKDIAFDFDCDWTADGRRRGEVEERAAVEAIASALANAEREGMRRAAEIARTSGHWEAAKYDGSPWPATGAVWRGLDANQIADKILSESERA